jgi:hypothetical protein
MSRASRIGLVLLVAVGLLTASAGVAQQRGQSRRPEEDELAPRITLEMRNAAVLDVVDALARQGVSYVLSGEIPSDATITVMFQNLDMETALHTLGLACSQVGVGCQALGSDVLILFPMEKRRRGGSERGASGDSDGGRALVPPSDQELERYVANRLVDLEAEDAPLRDVITQLNAQLSEHTKAYIIVDDSVPEGIRITAKVHKMPFAWLLRNLTAQANLSWSKDYESREGEGQNYVVVHVVPKPVLKTSRAQGGE